VDKIKLHGVRRYTYRALIILRTVCVLSLSDIQSLSQILLIPFLVTVRCCKLVGKLPGHFKWKGKESYVYWTVHHLDSWIKRDQIDVACFIISLFNVQHVSGVNTSILRSLRHIFWVISLVVLLWFDVCCCYVVVWLWWCGIRMQVEALVLQPAYGYHTTTAKPQRNTNTHRTRAIQPMK